VFGCGGAGKTNMVREISGKGENEFYELASLDGFPLSDAQVKERIADLMRECERGFHVGIHVVRQGRITEAVCTEYEVVRAILPSLAVICIVTYCENEEPMHKWVQDYSAHFLKCGLRYALMSGTCFAEGEGRYKLIMDKLRATSATTVRQCLSRTSNHGIEKYVHTPRLEQDLVRYVLKKRRPPVFIGPRK